MFDYNLFLLYSCGIRGANILMCDKRAIRDPRPLTPDELYEAKVALDRKRKKGYNEVLEDSVR